MGRNVSPHKHWPLFVALLHCITSSTRSQKWAASARLNERRVAVTLSMPVAADRSYEELRVRIGPLSFLHQ
jgi:hypothetical protein